MTESGATGRSSGTNRRRVARAALLMVVLFVIGGACGYGIGATQSATYQASDQALIKVWSVDSLVLTGQATELTSDDEADAATILTSQDVMSRAVTTLGERGLTAADLRDAVTATPSLTSHFVDFTVTAPSAKQASARIKAIGSAFVAVANAKVLREANRLAALPTSQLGTSSPAAQIRLRARLVAQTEPVGLYPAGTPTRAGTSATTAAVAGAILGLAIGAIVIVVSSFRASRVTTGSDVFRWLGLPGLDWGNESGPSQGFGRSDDLGRIAEANLVAVCPATPADDAAAEEVSRWLVANAPGASSSASTFSSSSFSTVDASHAADPYARRLSERPKTTSVAGGRAGRRAQSESGTLDVIRVSSPAVGLAVGRPDPADVDALILVTAAGVRVADLEQAVHALSEWRAIDGVVVWSGRSESGRGGSGRGGSGRGGSGRGGSGIASAATAPSGIAPSGIAPSGRSGDGPRSRRAAEQNSAARAAATRPASADLPA